MEINQKVYVLASRKAVVEDIVTKVTKRVITLASGKQFNANSDKFNGHVTFYYGLNWNDYLVLSRIDAEYILLENKYDNFDVESYKNIKYPPHVSQPRLTSVKPTIDEITKYQFELTQYELDEQEYKIKKATYEKEISDWMEYFRYYLARRDGLDKYPQRIRDMVYAKSNEMGHSNGYYEVANYHSVLADLMVSGIDIIIAESNA